MLIEPPRVPSGASWPCVPFGCEGVNRYARVPELTSTWPAALIAVASPPSGVIAYAWSGPAAACGLIPARNETDDCAAAPAAATSSASRACDRRPIGRAGFIAGLRKGRADD